MRRQSFLAAALFAAFPVVSLFAVNADQVPAHEGLRALVVSVFAAWALLLVARLLTRDWSRASLLTAGLVLLFYSYGHVYSFVEGLLLGGFNVGRHRYLFPVWGLVAVIWVYWVAIRHRRLSFRLAPLVGVGAALVVLPLIPMAAPMLTALRPQTANAPSQASPSTDAALPNIYYIIVDGYGRSDVLKDLYGADNSDFITFLERRGFFVATDARSNYSKTILSLASSLNMRYLDDVVQTQGVESTNRQPLIHMIQDSEVRRTLEAAGYRTVGFETGYPPTELTDASLYFGPPAADSSGAALGWASGALASSRSCYWKPRRCARRSTRSPRFRTSPKRCSTGPT